MLMTQPGVGRLRPVGTPIPAQSEGHEGHTSQEQICFIPHPSQILDDCTDSGHCTMCGLAFKSHRQNGAGSKLWVVPGGSGWPNGAQLFPQPMVCRVTWGGGGSVCRRHSVTGAGVPLWGDSVPGAICALTAEVEEGIWVKDMVGFGSGKSHSVLSAPPTPLCDF